MLQINMEAAHLKVDMDVLNDLARILRKKIETKTDRRSSCAFTNAEMDLLNKVKNSPTIGGGRIFTLIQQIIYIQETEYAHIYNHYQGGPVVHKIPDLLAEECWAAHLHYKYWKNPNCVMTGAEWMEGLLEEIKYQIGIKSNQYAQYLENKDYNDLSHPIVGSGLVHNEIRHIAPYHPLVY